MANPSASHRIPVSDWPHRRQSSANTGLRLVNSPLPKHRSVIGQLIAPSEHRSLSGQLVGSFHHAQVNVADGATLWQTPEHLSLTGQFVSCPPEHRSLIGQLVGPFNDAHRKDYQGCRNGSVTPNPPKPPQPQNTDGRFYPVYNLTLYTHKKNAYYMIYTSRGNDQASSPKTKT